MLTMKSLFLGIAVLGAGLFAATALPVGTIGHEVAGHRFHIPAEHIYDERIFWLPAPEKDSFVFLLQPNPGGDQIPPHRVLVEPLSRLCPTESMVDAGRMLRIVCGQEDSKIADDPPYLHVKDDHDHWASELFAISQAKTANGKKVRRPVAYCQTFEPNPAKPDGATICTTFWAFNNLKLQFSFDLNEAAQLPQMKAKAMDLLKRWEVR